MPRVSASRALPPLFAPTLPSAPRGLYVGTSGWAYASWKPGFYPPAVSAKNFLSFYSSQLNSVEVNYTFRTLPMAAQLQAWVDAVPAGFRLSFKAPQRITHFQRLNNSEDTLAEFLGTIALAEKHGKLGVVLFQLPPNFKADPARLRSFLSARSLASRRAPRIAFEFRHQSWFTDETFSTLRQHNAALCVAETEDFFTPDIQTAPHRCYRLRVSGGYSAAKLNSIADRLSTLAAEGDVYAYLKHEDEPTGALNATALLRRASKNSAPSFTA